jgi:exopolyphosphatase/guanosine-5'-triphosphate,3'-diphosphate pyrophosphatase
MGVRRTYALATAAARDAGNGPEFIARVRKVTGLPVRILSGADEARISALGVLAGTPGSHGAMGDLGGGSLELVALGEGKTRGYVTLPFGPLRLKEYAEKGRGRLKDMIDERLKPLDFLDKGRDAEFYAVGGAWRAIAKLHMAHSGYGLEIIHHYTIARDRAIGCVHGSLQSSTLTARARGMGCGLVISTRSARTPGSFSRSSARTEHSASTR